MPPCSATGRQIGSDWGWDSSETTEVFFFFWGGVVFCTNLEEMFKCTATILNTQLATQQRLTCKLKTARLLPDGCCCLNGKGNEILYRINISPPLTMIAGLYRVGQWLGLPGHHTSHQWTSSYGATLKPCDLHVTSCFQKESYCPCWGSSNRRASKLAFLTAQVSRCCIVSCVSRSVADVGTSALNWYEIIIFFFFRILKWLWLISNLGQAQFDIP